MLVFIQGVGEQHHLQTPGTVIQRTDADTIAALGDHDPRGNNEPGRRGHFTTIGRMHVFESYAANVALDLFQILVNRVPGQIQPQGLPFAIQHHLFRPRLTVGVGLLDLLRLFRQHAEHIRLADGFGFGVLIGGLQRIAQ